MVYSKAKRRIALVLVMMFLVSLSAMSVSAYSVSRTLGYKDTWVRSSELSGVKKVQITSGSNSGNSKRSVYFSIESKVGGWHYDSSDLIKPGYNASKTTISKTKATNYRLELNPYGTNTTGCSALGTLTAK